MNTLNWQVPQSVTFEEAIKLTQSLIEQMETGNLTELEIQDAIASLVKSDNGARGFFVTYLTDDRSFADNPSTGVIHALQTYPEVVSEFLVKNLVMSASMAVTHRRNQDEEMAQGSEQVRRRVANLIKQVNLDLVSEKLQQMKESAAIGEGTYQTFLQRWGYDIEQRQVMQEAIDELSVK